MHTVLDDEDVISRHHRPCRAPALGTGGRIEPDRRVEGPPNTPSL
jgi:hypothetical protein